MGLYRELNSLIAYSIYLAWHSIKNVSWPKIVCGHFIIAFEAFFISKLIFNFWMLLAFNFHLIHLVCWATQIGVLRQSSCWSFSRNFTHAYNGATRDRALYMKDWEMVRGPYCERVSVLYQIRRLFGLKLQKIPFSFLADLSCAFWSKHWWKMNNWKFDWLLP